MTLDADKLSAAADAHQERLKSSLWDEDASPDEALAEINQERLVATVPSKSVEGPPSKKRQKKVLPPETMAPVVVEPVAELKRDIEQVKKMLLEVLRSDRVSQHSPTNFPSWLLDAAGDPNAYDFPDGNRNRKTQCIRVCPDLLYRLKQMKARLGMRTEVGAWELILRLGIAATEHMPPHKKLKP